MSDKTHWDEIYASRPSSSLSWHQQGGGLSLEGIRQMDLLPSAGIIDVGGGTSRLMDELLAAEYQDLTVLDLSRQALVVMPADRGALHLYRPGLRSGPATATDGSRPKAAGPERFTNDC